MRKSLLELLKEEQSLVDRLNNEKLSKSHKANLIASIRIKRSEISIMLNPEFRFGINNINEEDDKK